MKTFIFIFIGVWSFSLALGQIYLGEKKVSIGYYERQLVINECDYLNRINDSINKLCNEYDSLIQVKESEFRKFEDIMVRRKEAGTLSVSETEWVDQKMIDKEHELIALKQRKVEKVKEAKMDLNSKLTDYEKSFCKQKGIHIFYSSDQRIYVSDVYTPFNHTREFIKYINR